MPEDVQKQIYDLSVDLKVAEQKVLDLEKENSRLYAMLERYVTLARFLPLEKAVYGGIGVVLIGVLTAVLTQVL